MTTATPQLYLSRLLLNPTSRQVQCELRDPYQMHRTLCKAFGDRPGELDTARCLFRVEGGRDGAVPVLVQSLLAPAWDCLTVSPGYLIAPPEEPKHFSPSFVAGQRLAFRLRANPTIKRDGKRFGITKEEDQYAWLQRKGETAGFQPSSVDVRRLGPTDFRVGNTHDARFFGVTFNGLLLVTEPERLLTALASGIGSAKAFGFGLLSLARV